MASGEQSTPAMTWRPDSWGHADRCLFLAGLYVGMVDHHPTFKVKMATPWRAWAMTAEDGADAGWFATESEAKARLVAVVQDALAND